MLKLTCTLLKLCAGAHVNVVDPDVPSTATVEYTLKDNLSHVRESEGIEGYSLRFTPRT